jgi:hypothetical protein
MPTLCQTLRRISALVADRWKRHIKTAFFETPDSEASYRRIHQVGFNPDAIDLKPTRRMNKQIQARRVPVS